MMISGPVRIYSKLFLGFFICSFFFPYTIWSQGRYEWVSAAILFDMPKKFSLSLAEESRIRNFSGSLISQVHTDVELGYKLNKRIDFACIYRYAQKREDNQYFYARNRFSAEGSYDNNLRRLGYSYRLKYQIQSKHYKEDYFDEIADQYIRNRIKLTYNIRRTRIEPYLLGELFSPLNRYKLQTIDEYRFGAGLKVPLNKKNRLDVGLLYDHELNKKDYSAWILVVGYRFKAN